MSYKNTSVSIFVVFENQTPESLVPGTTKGGIRIEADDAEITRYENQNELNEDAVEDETRGPRNWFTYSGDSLSERGYYDYKGYQLFTHLRDLLTTLLEIEEKQGRRFDEKIIELHEVEEVFVLSYLDGEFVRCAFQNRYGQGGKINPTTKAALGYAVELEELCEEMVRCGRELLEYMRRGFPDAEIANREGWRQFRDDIDDLEERIEARSQSENR